MKSRLLLSLLSFVAVFQSVKSMERPDNPTRVELAELEFMREAVMPDHISSIFSGQGLPRPEDVIYARATNELKVVIDTTKLSTNDILLIKAIISTQYPEIKNSYSKIIFTDKIGNKITELVKQN